MMLFAGYPDDLFRAWTGPVVRAPSRLFSPIFVKITVKTSLSGGAGRWFFFF